ncbi:carbohydrate esterase family 4 protein [Mycena albidolilacea]|uniref:chitin deacetylase n=1 Tax=Mycena albidolilacea TaxID=1033008 RepID=A0AAD7ETQ3_9AGAR|nr:carbohydrate esterase family 4 protein [Mycena albidolilacea]
MLAAVTLLLLHLLPAHGHSPKHNHDHIARNALPDTWFQPSDHAVSALFARDDFPPVGSDAWVASLPPFTPDGSHTPDITKLPQAWVDAYNAAKAAGNIPDIPQTTTGGQYPNNLNAMSADICSSYVGCRAPEDHFNVPDGTLALNFDDGPTEFTGQLLDFLKTNNEIATHFVIGYSIQQNVSAWQLLLNSGHDLAAHTWSHHQLTTQSDMEVISELGWSMNIIYLSTGGRVPRFWRPPTGDADNRIRAIAKYVFGMEMVVWNQDTEDWSLTETPPPTTTDVIAGQMKTWLNGPKSPGLMILEHELSGLSIGAFMAAYPLMKSAGWNLQSAARLVNTDGAYRNSPGPTGTVTAAGLLDFKGTGPSGTTNSTGNTSSGGSASVVKPTGSVSGTGSKPASTSTGSNASSKNGSASASSSSSPAPTGGAIRLDIAWFNALVLGVGAVTYMML